MLNPRKLLYPFSLLYGGIMLLRNEMYDRGIFRSKGFEIPVIAVGNLGVGGTGKSPMVEYLILLLKEEQQLATLSRGYKRSSRGFHLLNGKESASQVGDEPLQFKNKFPEILVAVDEKRSHGIEELLKDPSPPEVVLLDDAFQHRSVKAGFYILLTSYNNLYSEDLVLPAGNLREPKIGAKRADIIVVTKCPDSLSKAEEEQIRKKLDLDHNQQLFFTTIAYSDSVFGRNSEISLEELQKRHFTLVTGIANPQPLVDFLKARGLSCEHKKFPDHHNFSASEIKELQSRNLLVTTEKDYMRLKNDILGENLFYLPIQTKFLEGKAGFDGIVKTFARVNQQA